MTALLGTGVTSVEGTTESGTGRDSVAGGYLRLVVVLASLAAAVIHFGFAPAHFQQHWSHGLFFVVVGWLQLAWALLVMSRPSRALVWAGTANLLVVVVWVLSRTDGIPLVPLGSTVERVGFPDSLATALEALVVYGSFALVTGRRASSTPALPRRIAPVLATGVVVATLTAASFLPALAGNHAAHADRAATLTGSSAVPGAPAAVGSHAHGTGPTAGAQLGSAPTVAAPSGGTPCELAGVPEAAAGADSHAHRGPAAQVSLDRTTREQLAGQQAQARTVAAAFPTVAAAEAGGYRMSTPYVPCIGAHYTNYRRALAFDPAAPSELLFDGTAPTSRLVGLSYLVYHPGGAPEGFAGPNDVWHQHNANGGLCIAGTVVIGSEASTPAGCAALGGRKTPLVDVWMLHDWVVPGWECSWGTFAPDCPELGGRVGGSAWDAPVPAAVLPAG
ncbi:MAG: hypothetical protein M3Z02_06660 [Actinomycetota bacterium]|nr:hypothetical protein [Actinomycetota bacterium]